MTVRRAGDGHFRGKIVPIDVPAEGTRRERVTATMTRLAAAFEDLIADAPDQWWAVFFPIWPDLEAEAARAADGRGRPPTTARAPTGPRHDRRHADASAAPTCTSTRSPATARPASPRSSTTSSARTDLDVIAITDHERIDAAVAAQAIARDRGLRAEVVVGEEVTTLGGHLLGLYLDRPIRPYRSLRTTILAVHEAGGLAIPAHPLVPYPLCAQGWVLRRLLDDPDPAARPDGLETFNPTSLGKPWHRRVVRFADDHGLAHVGNSDAHALDGDRARAGRRSPAATPRTCAARSRRGTTEHGGDLPRDGRPARHVRQPAAQARPRRARRGRRPGPARRHRARPRLSRRPPPTARATNPAEPGSTERR